MERPYSEIDKLLQELWCATKDHRDLDAALVLDRLDHVQQMNDGLRDPNARERL